MLLKNEKEQTINSYNSMHEFPNNDAEQKKLNKKSK
jgi:hypothetical protein